jgi:hypothetical protein
VSASQKVDGANPSVLDGDHIIIGKDPPGAAVALVGNARTRRSAT